MTLAPTNVGVPARPAGLIMKRVMQPESVRKVRLYTPAGKALSPAAEGLAAFLAPWITHWSASH